jgi:hypothetical protein
MSKQKQTLFIIIFAIFSWVDISAQLIMEDVVYLKNGSVIRGIILKNENDTLRIAGFRSHIYVFNSEDIKKTEQEEIGLTKHSIRTRIFPDYKGFYSYTTMGMLVGKSESNDSETYSFRTICGHNFNRYAGIGLGTGIEKLQTEIIPVFVSFRSNSIERSNSPIIIVNLGYSFPLSKEKDVEENYTTANYHYVGGISAGFDIGIHSYKFAKRAFTITAGYQYQLVKETRNIYYWWENSTETNTYQFNRIAIKIGFMFM